MRPRTLMLIAIGIVVLFLGLPMIGYASASKGNTCAIVKVQMSKASSTATTADYKITITSGAKQGYFEYVGSWWGGIMKPGESALQFPRLGVDIVITGYGVRPDGQSSGLDRTDYSYGYAYTYGNTFTQTYKLPANHGDSVSVELRIYDGWGQFTNSVKTVTI